jgi:quercetin dioxygenase-like cupin family protein
MILNTHHHFSDNLYAKEIFIPKGCFAVQHQHTYDHLSVLAKGKVAVKTDEGVKVYTAPACLNIVKNYNHAVEALEDSVWYCIHSTSETDIDKIDEVLIKENV